MALLISLISFIIAIFTIILFRRKCYEDKDFTIKPKIPLLLYVTIIILSMIPVLGFITDFFVIAGFIKLLTGEEVYYKPGWFIKLLLKEV